MKTPALETPMKDLRKDYPDLIGGCRYEKK
jgi:hypothetical protein